ncbi:MAG: Hpt domain-containing protein [Gammaproteobacteria bacterium]|nr:Hpt domain-containing protein [Gammaproteobacteria bacterium]
MSDTISTPNDPPVRDESAALECAGGDAALADELLTALLEGLPAEIDQLRADVAESDWTGLAEHAHQTRGATRYCGVPALDEALATLERAARRGDATQIPCILAEVESQAERLAVTIRARSGQDDRHR